MEIPRENLSLLRELGRGQFGLVMEASAVQLPGTDGRPATVAVKYLRENSTAADAELFALEAVRMQRLRHSNVVGMLAVCMSSAPQCIVLEFMSNGDVKQYVQLCVEYSKTQQQALASVVGSKHLLRIVRDASRGLAYLSEARFVHRDIAARNVLLDERWNAKLGDFGEWLLPLCMCMCL